MVSYAGITCMIHLCHKWTVDRCVKGLEFVTAVWRKAEDRHTILPAIVSCLYGHVLTIVV